MGGESSERPPVLDRNPQEKPFYATGFQSHDSLQMDFRAHNRAFLLSWRVGRGLIDTAEERAKGKTCLQ
jgi:hypothetical protein